MTAPKHEPDRAERLVDFLVDGIERGITKIPAPVLGIAIGLFLGWMVNILATVGPVEYMSPLEAEAMNYNGGRSLLPEPGHPDVIQIPGGATMVYASRGSRTGCDSTLVHPPEDY